MEEAERPVIELEVREPTGLRLGVYDLFVIRQKIYQGDLRPNCEYEDPGDGEWHPLSDHPAFAEVFWLTGAGDAHDSAHRVKFGGWKLEGSTTNPGKAVHLAARKAAKSGLLGRFFGKK
jgi:hypothetical protein